MKLPSIRNKAAAVHNKLVPAIIRRIDTEIRMAGGSPQDTMVALESIVAGVVTVVSKRTTGQKTPQELFDLMAAAMPERLAELEANIEGLK